MDLSDGRLLWPKVLTLFIVSAVIPLAMPRRYTPVDPKVKNAYNLGKVIDVYPEPNAGDEPRADGVHTVPRTVLIPRPHHLPRVPNSPSQVRATPALV